jgi:hypothetical protein
MGQAFRASPRTIPRDAFERRKSGRVGGNPILVKTGREGGAPGLVGWDQTLRKLFQLRTYVFWRSLLGAIICMYHLIM